MNFPWLLSRKRILVASLVDIILFILNFFIFFYYIKLSFFLPKLFFVIILLTWILMSYLSGRYIKNELNILYYLFKNFFKIFILLSLINFLSYFFYAIFYKINNFDVSTDYTKIFIFFFIFSASSFFIQSLFSLAFSKKFQRKKIWGYIGNTATKLILEENLTQSRVFCELKFFHLNKNKFTFEGLLIEDLDTLESEEFDEILLLKENGVQILSPLQWSEKYIQRYPPELIKTYSNLFENLNFAEKQFTLRIKRLGDITFSIFLILLSLPVLLFASLLIMIEDGGPILYSQTRTGLKGRPFRIYKLRTMVNKAEKKGPKWSTYNDPRITKTGRLLRKFRIDELPQLWSVIKGEMSLIGPRPERPEFDKKLENEIPYYRLRNILRPGLSGWAQVNYHYGATKLDSKNKLSFDLFYIKNISLLIDFLIMFKTIKTIIYGEGSNPK